MSFVVVQALTGLADAASLFLVAVGLSLVFGVSRIVNFAHGSFYMLGAYAAYSASAAVGGGLLGFVAGAATATAALAGLGLVVEVGLLRRLYAAPELLQLVATFAVVLLVQDLALAVWGPEDLLLPRVPALSEPIIVLGHRLPLYDFVLIALGPLVLAGLWLLLSRTRWGILIRAATEDREMVAALGIDQRWLFTSVFCLGAALAGLGGAIHLPREPANLMMDLGIIAEAFVVVVVGGMGSMAGAYLAAVLIAELRAFGIVLFPEITLVLLFAVMAVILVVRPYGLLGRPDVAGPQPSSFDPHPASAARQGLRLAIVAGLVGLVAVPLFAGGFTLQVMSEIFIFALFAASLQFILGIGGMISFGHAAYFGLGAYGAALAVHHLNASMPLALIAAPLVGGLGALVYGWFCVRLSGVYMAMLTLAFAQITWSVAFQWYDFTGGDNGILGVWPAPWAASPSAFYYLSLAVVTIAIWLLRRISAAPFGFALRAGRDAGDRAEALGVDVRRQRWLAFSVAGAAAATGGGLYAFLKGSVFPDVLAIPMSVDGLVMVLLGGIDRALGPLVGAATFTGLKITISSATDLWRSLLGGIIIAVVLIFPRGILGTVGGQRRGGAK
ncbi:MAG: ABC transporter permease [Rhodospirillales bacterium]|nr:ABC transporter permease [Rhodospirillales bacterium]